MYRHWPLTKQTKERVSDDNRLWVGNLAATFLAEVSKANLNLGFETQAETFKILYAVLFYLLNGKIFSAFA
jgi:hypothetical protein